MDLENLVQRLASKIRPGTLLTIVTSDLGVNLCLDDNGHWHECFSTVDKNLENDPIETILMILVAMKGYVMPSRSKDVDPLIFPKQIEYYIESNKQKLIAELMTALNHADQALTS